MKGIMAGAVLLGLATALAGCSGSDSKASTAPAASIAAPAASTAASTSADATASSVTKASSTTSSEAPTSAPAAGGGDTCQYLSASEASALLANAGPAKVTSADTALAKQTSCSWGTGLIDRIFIVANELKTGAPASAIKAAVEGSIIEKIDGLGDVGGFETKTADAVSVVFVKGSFQVLLSVSTKGVNTDAVVAAAKKIAAGI